MQKFCTCRTCEPPLLPRRRQASQLVQLCGNSGTMQALKHLKCQRGSTATTQASSSRSTNNDLRATTQVVKHRRSNNYDSYHVCDKQWLFQQLPQLPRKRQGLHAPTTTIVTTLWYLTSTEATTMTTCWHTQCFMHSERQQQPLLQYSRQAPRCQQQPQCDNTADKQ